MPLWCKLWYNITRVHNQKYITVPLGQSKTLNNTVIHILVYYKTNEINFVHDGSV